MQERILVIINTMNVGGAETFIMKVFRAMNKAEMIFDFLVSEEGECTYEKELISSGSRVFHGKYKSQHFLKSIICTRNTVKINRYKKVLIFSQHPMVFFDALACSTGGAERIVVRSTNTSCDGSIQKVLAIILRPFMNQVITDRIAPSTEAAKWLFGRYSNKARIIKNGLNITDFKYSDEKRESIRGQYSLENCYVIGHIGRFNEQKNHEYLIEIFKNYSKDHKEARLLLIGEGELQDTIRQKVIKYGLENLVIFTGIQSDVTGLLCAMDLMVFPSFYEGMPNVIVEAQASGLKCLISDKITREAKITDICYYLPIEKSPEEWSKYISNIRELNVKRELYAEKLKKAGYSIVDTTNALMSVLA